MKKLNFLSRTIVAIVAMLSGGLPAIAYPFEVDGIYYNITDGINKTVEVTQGAYSGSVSIPSSVTYNGTTYSVTKIGAQAFYDCYRLTEVTIPNSVTKIGNEAFSGCSGLTEVTIGNSVTEIGYGAFNATPWYNNQPDGVIYINNVLYKYKGTMPAGTSIEVKDGTISISGNAFSGCSGLTSVTIGNSVTEIGYGAFSDCTGLTSVTIPNSVTSIDDNAFFGTGWYNNQPYGILYLDNCCLGYKGNQPTGTLSLKNDTRLIGNEAFMFCSGLTSVSIGNSVTSIGDRAFDGCSGLTEVNISDLSAWCNIEFKHIFSNPLAACRPFSPPFNTTKLVLNGEEIKDLVIPNNITQIKSVSFYGASISSVTIPNSVTEIGEYAFNSCSRLTEVTSLNPEPPTCGDCAFYDSYSAILKVPEGTKDAYANAPEWKKFTNIQEIAGVEDVEVDNNAVEVGRYDIHGHQLSEPTKGVNIIKMSDGSIRKELMK